MSFLVPLKWVIEGWNPRIHPISNKYFESTRKCASFNVVKHFAVVHLNKPSGMGANLGGKGVWVPPIIQLHPPQYFHTPHQRSRWPCFFFGLHYILGKKLVIWEVKTFFFLVFTLLHFTVVGKNLGNRAGVSNLLNHSPQSRKMVNFAESSPLMLIIDLHSCPLDTRSNSVATLKCKSIRT